MKARNRQGGRAAIFLGAALLVSLFSACAGAGTAAHAAPGTFAPEGGATAQKAPPRPETPPERSGLESAAFEKCPAEARGYLEVIEQAFRRRDKDFLLAQGETQYEKDVRPLCGDDEYLALLYRCGVYAGESSGSRAGVRAVDVDTVRGIRFIRWKEQGPHIFVEARLIPVGEGRDIPCELVLVWRLIQPKVLGVYP